MLAFHGDLGLMMTPVLAKMRNYAVGKTDCVNVLQGLCERVQGNVDRRHPNVDEQSSSGAPPYICSLMTTAVI